MTTNFVLLAKYCPSLVVASDEFKRQNLEHVEMSE